MPMDEESPMVKLSRAFAFGCLVLLAILAWVPGEEMVRTGFDGRIEHVVAHFGTSVAVSLSYGFRIGQLRLIGILVCYAGILELGQNFSPGRNASVFDFLASSLGVVAGAVAFRVACRLFRATPIGFVVRRINRA